MIHIRINEESNEDINSYFQNLYYIKNFNSHKKNILIRTIEFSFRKKLTETGHILPVPLNTANEFLCNEMRRINIKILKRVKVD